MLRIFLQFKTLILDEVGQMEGFMRLLMKHRNGVPWTPDEKQALSGHLHKMAKSVPVLIIFTLPGGLFFLPALAWFLDRRKNQAERRAASDLTGERRAALPLLGKEPSGKSNNT
jgi:hypothetical protein